MVETQKMLQDISENPQKQLPVGLGGLTAIPEDEGGVTAIPESLGGQTAIPVSKPIIQGN